MIEFIKANSSKKSDMTLICSLIKKSIIDMYSELLKPDAIKFSLKFVTPRLKKREMIEDGFEFYFIIKKNNNKKDTVGFIEFKNTKKDFLILEKIYILKEYRNKKIGYKALEKTITLAKDKNYKKINIYINQSFSNINKIFKKWGFKYICPMARYIGSNFYLYEHYFEFSL